MENSKERHCGFCYDGLGKTLKSANTHRGLASIGVGVNSNNFHNGLAKRGVSKIDSVHYDYVENPSNYHNGFCRSGLK